MCLSSVARESITRVFPDWFLAKYEVTRFLRLIALPTYRIVPEESINWYTPGLSGREKSEDFMESGLFKQIFRDYSVKRGTNRNALPSNRPLSLSLSSGITSNAMKERVIKGASRGHPSLLAVSVSLR